jgi:hypothetical protein
MIKEGPVALEQSRLVPLEYSILSRNDVTDVNVGDVDPSEPVSDRRRRRGPESRPQVARERAGWLARSDDPHSKHGCSRMSRGTWAEGVRRWTILPKMT